MCASTSLRKGGRPAVSETSWLALLRGINVGRNKRVAMSDLRALLESLGCKDVRTVQVSGNAVFRSAAHDEAALSASIAARIKKDLGLDVTVILRTGAELVTVIEKNPFLSRRVDPKQLHVVFLSAAPRAALLARVDRDEFGPDEFEAGPRVLYVRLPNGVIASRLPDWEKLLGVSATMRTWGTVLRLHAGMSSESER
jgi:uncharacterized protein (DUF1697 family)